MTRYYIDLKDYADTADIDTVGDDTLKEVIKDFTKELQKRTLNIANVSKCLLPEKVPCTEKKGSKCNWTKHCKFKSNVC